MSRPRCNGLAEPNRIVCPGFHPCRKCGDIQYCTGCHLRQGDQACLGYLMFRVLKDYKPQITMKEMTKLIQDLPEELRLFFQVECWYRLKNQTSSDQFRKWLDILHQGETEAANAIERKWRTGERKSFCTP